MRDDDQRELDGRRLAQRPTAALRPHPTYLALGRPIAASRQHRVAQQRGPIREPLLTTSDGTILDGHARWRVALDRHQPNLPCLECGVTDAEALQIVIQQHRASEGLNDFCRIVMALELEPFFKEFGRGSTPAAAGKTGSSNLTTAEQRDVRTAIARVAGVSTGNVTKVKQILGRVIPEVHERLVRGDVRIHRAWRWHRLSPKAQRDVLWEYLHGGAIRKTIARLIRAHATSRAPVLSDDVATTVLCGLTRLDAEGVMVGVIDLPGRAVVVTRACYDELRNRSGQ